MYPRTNYEMTEEELENIVAASKPVSAMMIGGTTAASPQENANNAWKALGDKLGFDYMTVRPINGKSNRYFSAVPSETQEQKEERQKREAEENRLYEIAKLESKMAEIREELIRLRG